MKKNLLNSVFILSILIVISLNSCKKDNNTIPSQQQGEKLVYITNQGAFLHDNGSISIIKTDSNIIVNDYFEYKNGRPAGDVVQSMGLANGKGYIVANNSNLIKVVNLLSFKEIAELSVIYPRYFLEIDTTKAYITSGSMQGWVQVVNLQTNKVTDSIEVGNGPENIVKSGNYVYVANCGGFKTDSTVSIIDPLSKKVIKNIIVGENPVDMVVDVNSNVWVICEGYYNLYYQRGESKIVKINHSTLAIDETFIEGKANDNYASSILAISSDKSTIYYQDSLGIFAFPINGSSLPLVPLISSTTQFAGLSVDPSNGDIYCLDAGNYSTAGAVDIYDKNGIFKKSYSAGIGTCGAYFNY
jgi:YVTN family beta-propeller protein